MKTLITVFALASTLFAIPAFIQSASAGPDQVFMGGKNIGQDPDANVRLQLRRDAGSENY
jgi:hypothetical protein